MVNLYRGMCPEQCRDYIKVPHTLRSITPPVRVNGRSALSAFIVSTVDGRAATLTQKNSAVIYYHCIWLQHLLLVQLRLFLATPALLHSLFPPSAYISNQKMLHITPVIRRSMHLYLRWGFIPSRYEMRRRRGVVRFVGRTFGPLTSSAIGP